MRVLSPDRRPVQECKESTDPILTIRCFGPRLRLWSRGKPVDFPVGDRLPRATLALLGIVGPTGISTDRMVRTFAPLRAKAGPRTESMNVSRAHTVIFRMRTALSEIIGPEARSIIVVTGSKTFALDPAMVDCDGFRYRRLLESVVAGSVDEGLAAFDDARVLPLRGVPTEEKFAWQAIFPVGGDAAASVDAVLEQALRRAVECRLAASVPGRGVDSLTLLRRWLSARCDDDSNGNSTASAETQQ